MSRSRSAGYIVILCAVLILAITIGSTFSYHRAGAVYIHSGLAASMATSYLLYPLLGWLADVYFTRYKVIRLSFVIITMSATCGAITGIIAKATILQSYDATVHAGKAVAVPVTIAFHIGTGLFQANAIQFGMDQLLEESSEQLSTFIHWYYWSLNLAFVPVKLVAIGVLLYYSNCKMNITDISHKYYTSIYIVFIIFITVIQLSFGLIGLCLLICTKKHLNIERPGHNPLKLIYNVLKYAWKHTCPENRSAFTYWENDVPPRIDLGKSKYGGPFTTEEVEDTKSFLHILLLLFPLLGFFLSNRGYSIVDQFMRKECPSYWVLMLVGDPKCTITLIILIGVPFHQFIILRCCRKYLPNMLKRMGLGLLCCLLKEIAVIVLLAIHDSTATQECHHIGSIPFFSCYYLRSHFAANGTCSTINELTNSSYNYYCHKNNGAFLLLIIPQVLQGLSYILVFMTTIEFICAQAPLQLKGLLIGIWYSSISINSLLDDIPYAYISDSTTWEVFNEVKAFLIALSLLFFMYVSERYHYRLRDEVVNEQFLVEEIYERNFQLAEEYEKEKRAEMRALFGDPVSRPHSYYD